MLKYHKADFIMERNALIKQYEPTTNPHLLLRCEQRKAYIAKQGELREIPARSKWFSRSGRPKGEKGI